MYKQTLLALITVAASQPSLAFEQNLALEQSMNEHTAHVRQIACDLLEQTDWQAQASDSLQSLTKHVE